MLTGADAASVKLDAIKFNADIWILFRHQVRTNLLLETGSKASYCCCNRAVTLSVSDGEGTRRWALLRISTFMNNSRDRFVLRLSERDHQRSFAGHNKDTRRDFQNVNCRTFMKTWQTFAGERMTKDEMNKYPRAINMYNLSSSFLTEFSPFSWALYSPCRKLADHRQTPLWPRLQSPDGPNLSSPCCCFLPVLADDKSHQFVTQSSLGAGRMSPRTL